MNTKLYLPLFLLLAMSLIIAACAPAPAPSATPTAAMRPAPTATVTEWAPAGKIVQPTDLNDKVVRLMSLKTAADNVWLEVEVDGEIRWTKIAYLNFHEVDYRRGLHYFGDVRHYPDRYTKDMEVSFLSDLYPIGIWQTHPWYGDDIVNLWGYYYSSETDERILAYWSDFQPLADNRPYVVDGLLDTSPGRVATIMLNNWWLMPPEWDWESYQEVYQLVNGYLPNSKLARTYADFYGMAVDRISDGQVVVTFVTAPPEATVLGCLPPERILGETHWGEENLELLVNDFYVAHSGYLDLSTEGGQVQVRFTLYDRFVAVVSNFPVWPDQSWVWRGAPEGISIPELQLWELCRPESTN